MTNAVLKNMSTADDGRRRRRRQENIVGGFAARRGRRRPLFYTHFWQHCHYASCQSYFIRKPWCIA